MDLSFSPPTPEPAPFSPAAAWECAGEIARATVAAFGAPAAIAGRGVLAKGLHAILRSWLGALERLVRSLLLIDAAALPKPNFPPPRARLRKTHSASGRGGFASSDSADWGVSFRVTLAPGSRAKKLRTRSDTPRDTPAPLSAFPLAERLEAVLRVLADPAPVAQRLARRLHARPPRLRILKRTHRAAPFAALVEAAHTHARSRAAVFSDTS